MTLQEAIDHVAETGGIIDDGDPSAFIAGRAVQLDGHFTIDDLRALIVVMEARVDPYTRAAS